MPNKLLLLLMLLVLAATCYAARPIVLVHDPQQEYDYSSSKPQWETVMLGVARRLSRHL